MDYFKTIVCCYILVLKCVIIMSSSCKDWCSITNTSPSSYTDTREYSGSYHNVWMKHNDSFENLIIKIIVNVKGDFSGSFISSYSLKISERELDSAIPYSDRNKWALMRIRMIKRHVRFWPDYLTIIAYVKGRSFIKDTSHFIGITTVESVKFSIAGAANISIGCQPCDDIVLPSIIDSQALPSIRKTTVTTSSTTTTDTTAKEINHLFSHTELEKILNISVPEISANLTGSPQFSAISQTLMTETMHLTYIYFGFTVFLILGLGAFVVAFMLYRKSRDSMKRQEDTFLNLEKNNVAQEENIYDVLKVRATIDQKIRSSNDKREIEKEEQRREITTNDNSYLNVVF